MNQWTALAPGSRMDPGGCWILILPGVQSEEFADSENRPLTSDRESNAYERDAIAQGRARGAGPGRWRAPEMEKAASRGWRPSLLMPCGGLVACARIARHAPPRPRLGDPPPGISKHGISEAPRAPAILDDPANVSLVRRARRMPGGDSLGSRGSAIRVGKVGEVTRSIPRRRVKAPRSAPGSCLTAVVAGAMGAHPGGRGRGVALRVHGRSGSDRGRDGMGCHGTPCRKCRRRP